MYETFQEFKNEGKKDTRQKKKKTNKPYNALISTVPYALSQFGKGLYSSLQRTLVQTI